MVPNDETQATPAEAETNQQPAEPTPAEPTPAEPTPAEPTPADVDVDAVNNAFLEEGIVQPLPVPAEKL